MRIKCGWTRLVILTERKAIKIGCFSFLALPGKLLKSIFDRKWLMNRMRERTSSTKSSKQVIMDQIMFHLAGGMRANRQEYELFQTHPELPLAPVLNMYLNGAVLVMARGREVESSLSAELRGRFPGSDLHKPEHVCSFAANKLCFIDYGDPDAPRALGIL